MFKSKVTRNGERFVYQDKAEGDFSYGGINYFNYKDEPRGVYFCVSAVKIEHRNGMTIESFMMGQNKGMKMLVRPLERKSAKQVAAMAQLISPKVADIVELFKTDPQAAMAQVKASARIIS
jgi:uncharacterized protein with von Willebrand factor type A (vWA) domain